MLKILKFGGSSVANAKNINRVTDIVLESQKKGENIVVVVSALGGVTDDLIKLTKTVKEQNNILKSIRQRHLQTVQELIDSKNKKIVSEEVDKKFNELIKTLSKTGDISLQTVDAVMSFGEQLSAYIISEAIKSRGIACEFVDARDLIKTNDNFGEASVDIENSYKLIAENFPPKADQPRAEKNTNPEMFVMGGFIGSTKEGITTTLGRGGSDYTAALVGAALDASVIEIWTDVDGLMTADPRKVKNALTISEISYEQAEKMALAGAKVIHPKTMKPARLIGIPIYIKNTFNPKGDGTKISDNKK